MRTEPRLARTAWESARSELLKIKLEAILQEADVLFNRKGYNATSLDDIARRLKVTKTALYHYVRSKNELLYLCYQRAVELTEQCYERADDEGRTGLEKVIGYFRMDASKGVMSMTPLTELDAIKDAKRRQQLRQRISACEARFREFIEQGIRDGSIQKCESHLTSLFILGASRHVMQWYDPDAQPDISTITEYFIEFCRRSLMPAAALQERIDVAGDSAPTAAPTSPT